MDLKQQLEASIQKMESGKYEDAADMFEKVVKVVKSWQSLTKNVSNDTVMAAYNWVEELKHYWWNAKKDSDLCTLLFKEFEPLELKLKEHGEFTSWLDETKDLLRKITLTQNRLEERQKEEDALIYKPVSLKPESKSVLKDYEDIGECLLLDDSVVIKEMTELAKETYDGMRDTASNTAPSFIVCSSSGTGKTQLPFSLKIPLLYFCFECTGSDQKIYKIYEKISVFFMKLLNADFSTYIEALTKKPESISEIPGILDVQSTENSSSENDVTQSQQIADVKQSVKDVIFKKIACYSLDCFTVDCLKTVSCEYRAPSFLIQLIERIRALKESNEQSSQGNYYYDMNWPRLQLKVRGDEFTKDKLTIEKSKVKFNEIFSGKSVDDPIYGLPLVFLDEFNVSKKKDPESKAKYAFYRNIIRACGLIPVLMGTNSQITNVVTAGTASGKEKQIWARIFYKLPQYPWNLFEKNLAKVEGLSPSGRDILITLFPLLKQERPFFVKSIFEDFNELKEIDKNSNSIIPWLKFILSNFRSAFKERKSADMDYFYAHQAQLFMNSYNCSYNEGKAVPPLLINSYLAYLTPPADIEPKCDKSYFDVYQLGKKVQYKSKDKEGRKDLSDYQPNARLPTFVEEPLTCMAFSQNDNHISCSFKSDDKCFTVFQAITECRKVATQDQRNYYVQLDFEGSILEHIVSMAFMVSSHTKLLEGMEFKEWFERFIQQLACYTPNKFEKPKLIDFDSTFTFGDDFIVPYFAFDCAMWPKYLIELLPKDRCHLGTYFGAFYESRDLFATSDLFKYTIDSKSKKLRISENSHESTKEKESKSNDQNYRIESGGSNTRKRQMVPTDPSDQISPKSAKIFKNESEMGGIFSMECKLYEDNLCRSEIKKIIIKMKSANPQSIFNFIVAKQISPRIEFFPRSTQTESINIKQLKDRRKSCTLMNLRKGFKSQPTSTKSRTEKTAKRKQSSEEDQLENESVKLIPYNDISIYRLVKKCSKSPTKNLSKSECCYTSSQFKLQLAEVYYNSDVIPKAVFILIDLEEIHGATHLKKCIQYFKK